MPTINERLRHVTSKVERAKKHVANLNAEVVSFLKSNPYAVGIKRNPQTRQLIYYVSEVKETPDCLPLLAGDAIQNLMSAIDHLAYQIVCSDTADVPPKPNWIYFPISDTETKYEAKKHGKMEGASTDTFRAIDALKPYKGGNDQLWMLYRLNNVEKHRLLITVGSMFQSLNLGAIVIAKHNAFLKTLPVEHPLAGREVSVMDAFFKPADVLFPLKAGDELFVDAPDAEPNSDMQFKFNVALYEPQIVETQSLVELLHQLTALVEGIVVALTPRLR